MPQPNQRLSRARINVAAVAEADVVEAVIVKIIRMLIQIRLRPSRRHNQGIKVMAISLRLVRVPVKKPVKILATAISRTRQQRPTHQ